MNKKNRLAELKDLRSVVAACKDENEALRAGVMVNEDEFKNTPYHLLPSFLIVKCEDGSYYMVGKKDQ